MNNRLPVTLVISAPGTNGHQIYNRIVNDDDASRVTAIAPWPRSKATQAQSGLTLIRTTERMKRLGKGCSCCTVRGDILSKVRDIVEARSADQIVIQVPPRSDLEALSKTFSVADDQGRVLGNEAYVSRVVTVVDGGTVLNVARSSLADRLADLVGTAHAVWVDGAEGLGPEQLAEVVDVMGTMNPKADLLHGNGADILLSKFPVEALSPPALEPLAADTPGGLQVGASCVLPTR